MNSENLSKRLHTVVSYIPKGSVLADIGSDHAYLPCYAVYKGLVQAAIAGEVVDGPFKSAQNQVKQEGLEGFISVRKGDGLDVLNPGEATCITIAGMGGTLISNILERGKDKLEGTKRLVLQPNIQAINIRKWLIENDWILVAEEILEEDGKIYEVLVAEKDHEENPYSDNKEAELLLGPFLMKECNDVFKKKWNAEYKHWQDILKQLQASGKTESSEEKQEQLKRYSRFVEEALSK
ncbi:tRNA (adenine(22)-N(1))-methyltransferase [Bacillus massiliigorillae]|uniref:tRNA (adenine(22)-N(1))-methyltransferase n=1 Tax=Bacillus massiliigorillae TaxID=1243664 RepID=UPI00039EBBD1|nr:tRNA (adenine(22)-N(1))-methyltransferase TrmK [Bacillus massiliigorillae]